MKTRYLVVLLVLPFILKSETILIHSSNNAKGQGWLFGSRIDTNCWIAVPKHVIEKSKNGEVANFQWRDLKGLEGTGIDIIVPKKGLDLAFAKVLGRQKGQCLSRLGSSNISFAIDRQPVVEAIIMQTTHVEPRQMQLRDFNDELIRFVPVNAHAKKEMKPGLSGAPMLLKSANNQKPMGMIVTVDKTQEFGYAVRFDLIKSLFEESISEQKNISPNKTTQPLSENSILFQLINSTGISRDADSTAQAVISKQGCWSTKPAINKRSFSIDVIPRENSQSKQFSKINFRFDESCGSLPDSIIIQKPQGNDWITLSSCETNQSQTTCNTLKQSFDILRLVIIKRDGSHVGIGQITIF